MCVSRVVGAALGVLFLSRGDNGLAVVFLLGSGISLVRLGLCLRRGSADVTDGPSPSDP